MAFLALLIFGLASQGDDTAIDEAVAKGERPAAPSSTLALLGGGGGGGEEAALADYKGQVVVLNFWASWCPPCIDELPLLEELQRGLRSSGATVLGVNYKDIPEDAEEFVDEYGLSYPNLRDGDGEFADLYGTLGMPETFIIDRSGRIAALRRGPIDQQWLDETLPPILAEQGAQEGTGA